MLQSYQELIEAATKELYEVSDSPRIDAEVLLQHCLQKDLAWLIAHNNQVAEKPEVKAYQQLIQQRYTGKPIAYITGTKSFWTFDLQVNEAVLIPRPDTETLVELALEKLHHTDALNVLDLGTGSGAIALALASERPQAQIIATDAHPDALNVARNNAQQLQENFPALTNIEFIQSDWFSALSGDLFHLIVSNPPYIDPVDPHLEREIRFEPETALVSSDEGLADLENIIQSAKHHLHNEGWLLVEHGYNQEKAVAKLFLKNGFDHIETHKDLNNNPRVTLGQRNLKA